MDHPASRERIDLLQDEVDSSPYKDVKDSPETIHEFNMIRQSSWAIWPIRIR